VPVLDALEKKATEMNELHPELKDLSKKLDVLADFSDMKMAKLAGSTIKQIYKANALSIEPTMKANLLDNIKSNYENSKQSFKSMESNLEKMEK
jgi:hypothetical protein